MRNWGELEILPGIPREGGIPWLKFQLPVAEDGFSGIFFFPFFVQ